MPLVGFPFAEAVGTLSSRLLSVCSDLIQGYFAGWKSHLLFGCASPVRVFVCTGLTLVTCGPAVLLFGVWNCPGNACSG